MAGEQDCYVYSLDPPESGATAYARFFNPTVGLWEDRATGSATCNAAAHLVAHGAVSGGRIRVQHGHARGRPSRIEVNVDGRSVRLVRAGIVVATGAQRLTGARSTRKPSSGGALVRSVSRSSL